MKQDYRHFHYVVPRWDVLKYKSSTSQFIPKTINSPFEKTLHRNFSF